MNVNIKCGGDIMQIIIAVQINKQSSKDRSGPDWEHFRIFSSV